MTRWYRAYEGTVTDAKLGEVAMVAGCSRSVAIAAWHCILESAAVENSGGVFDATPRRVAVILGEPLSVIEAVFAELTALGMVSENKVTAWSKRQYESDSSTERSRKSRERAKTVAVDECNNDATLQDRCATPPETETETENTNLTVSKPSKRGTRIPDDFEPDESCHRLASEELSMTATEFRFQLQNFLDYWRAVPGAKGLKLDWQATFRKWLRTSYERKRPSNVKSKPSSAEYSTSVVANAIDIELAAARAAERGEHSGFEDSEILPGFRQVHP